MVEREDGRKIVYICKSFPQSQFCNVEAYSPLNNLLQCNGQVCWPSAWNYKGGCTGTGTYNPTSAPTFDAGDLIGCPEEYDSTIQYQEGDKISVKDDGGDIGKVYECKSWPSSEICKREAYKPGLESEVVNGKPIWKDAWTYVGGCSGTNSPTVSPTFDEMTGCPEEYNTITKYGDGDEVSIKGDGEDVGKVYRCRPWPNSVDCEREEYKPGPDGDIVNGNPIWQGAWTYIGGCSGTLIPTVSPTFDPAIVSGCPGEYDSSTTYEEGDKVSILEDGVIYGKVYKCKGWPQTEFCNREDYQPGPDGGTYKGEPLWKQAWTFEGGCDGTITPTQSPMFQSITIWDKIGCPDEYVPNNGNYKPLDYVSVPKNEDNTLGVVWQCKNAQSAPLCKDEGFAPGTEYGGQAWEMVGHCSGIITPTESPTLLSSNLNSELFACQFKYKLTTTDNGEYVVLQAGAWEKGGTTVASVSGGEPFELYDVGYVVRSGREAYKCSGYPFTPHCNQFSPFVKDHPDYNPIHSPQGWHKTTCENVRNKDEMFGHLDEFDPTLPGPLFASNGDVLVDYAGECTNLATNPADYFKKSPAFKGCHMCDDGYGFGTPDDERNKCFPCQRGYMSKIIEGKTMCVIDPSSYMVNRLNV